MIDALKKSKKQGQEEHLKYRNLYENSPNLLQTVDIDGIILDCNQSYYDTLGYDTKNKIIGTSMLDSIADQSKEKMIKTLQIWKNLDKSNPLEIWLERKDGSNFPTIINSIGVYDENHKLIGRNNTIQNISYLYKAMKTNGEKEILELKMKQLKKIDKQKDEFSSMISHELKTPLATIKGYSEILQEPTISKTFTSVQKESINKIYENAGKLELLIEDVLDSQKLTLEKMKFNKSTIRVNEFLTEIFNNFKPLMKTKQIQLNMTSIEKIDIFTDKKRFCQVLDNIIKNAVDFVPSENGEIEIGTKLQNDNIVFYIKDNGIGIAKDKQANIFKKFYQIDTTYTRSHGGTGLGLVICDGIMKGLGGEIWLESKGIGYGCVFYLKLPINQIAL